MFIRPLRSGLCLLFWAVSLDAQVVFNEIFYRGPDNLNDLQWIEFYNTTDKPASAMPIPSFEFTVFPL